MSLKIHYIFHKEQREKNLILWKWILAEIIMKAQIIGKQMLFCKKLDLATQFISVQKYDHI